MIDKIKIENFKSIQSLEIELGRLNVFIGANGSGKTNILEGIALGLLVSANKCYNEILVNRGVRITKEELMKSAFDKDSKSQNIEINLSNVGNILLDLVISFDFRANKWYALSDKNKNENTINLEKINPSFNTSDFENFAIFSPENTFLRKFEDEGALEPLGVKGEGLFKHIVKIFKENPEKAAQIKENLQLLDWFEDFDIPKDLMFTEKRIAIKDRFLENGLSYFDQRSANEGFLFLLFYFTLFISDETPNFFAIDNIDTAMNPKLGRKLIKVLAKLAEENKKQAILTTHNPAILDGLDLKDPEQRLFVVYRDLEGCTSVRRVFKKELKPGAEPVPLSEQFLRGYLGGLPDNF